MDDERDEWFQLRCGCFHKGGSILVKSSYCCLLYLILPFLPLLMNMTSGRLFNDWKFLWIFSKGRQPLCIVLSYIITMSWLWETKCFLFFLNVAIHVAEMDVIVLQIHWKLKFWPDLLNSQASYSTYCLPAKWQTLSNFHQCWQTSIPQLNSTIN